MYKIKSNTLFIGKNLIYLPSCQSTNDEAADLLRHGEAPEGTVVITDYQMAGRGQRGNQWQAQAGENLTFSLILRPRFLRAVEQFQLNMAVSLGVHEFLESCLGDSRTPKIKWPNDAYIGQHKVGGILIENSLQGVHIEHSVVGIGLNVNQLYFEGSRATSLRLATGQAYDLPTLLGVLLEKLEKNYLLLRNKHVDMLKRRYLAQLFRYQEPQLFCQNNAPFVGTIVGVSPEGRLAVQIKQRLEYFDFKEISYVFED
ncbi:MAG: biotin--[acetyl-CoA-carboxylase] ligase [Runella sp.]